MISKDERALEALLALAFRIELTDKEIEKFFAEPVQLSEELKIEIENWEINIENIISRYWGKNILRKMIILEKLMFLI